MLKVIFWPYLLLEQKLFQEGLSYTQVHGTHKKDGYHSWLFGNIYTFVRT